jgi:hypothetical protein
MPSPKSSINKMASRSDQYKDNPRLSLVKLDFSDQRIQYMALDAQ